MPFYENSGQLLELCRFDNQDKDNGFHILMAMSPADRIKVILTIKDSLKKNPSARNNRILGDYYFYKGKYTLARKTYLMYAEDHRCQIGISYCIEVTESNVNAMAYLFRVLNQGNNLAAVVIAKMYMSMLRYDKIDEYLRKAFITESAEVRRFLLIHIIPMIYKIPRICSEVDYSNYSYNYLKSIKAIKKISNAEKTYIHRDIEKIDIEYYFPKIFMSETFDTQSGSNIMLYGIFQEYQQNFKLAEICYRKAINRGFILAYDNLALLLRKQRQTNDYDTITFNGAEYNLPYCLYFSGIRMIYANNKSSGYNYINRAIKYGSKPARKLYDSLDKKTKTHYFSPMSLDYAIKK